MLTTLVIKDFAIISELELSFGPGMTVLSGETGAGSDLCPGEPCPAGIPGRMGCLRKSGCMFDFL